MCAGGHGPFYLKLCEGTKCAREVWAGQSSGELRRREAGCFLPKSGGPFEYMLGIGDCSEWANTRSSLRELVV